MRLDRSDRCCLSPHSRSPLFAIVMALGCLAPIGASARVDDGALLPPVAAPQVGKQIGVGGGALGPTFITRVWPQAGPDSGGTTVTITGSGFVTGAAVEFGGTSATSIAVVDSTMITAMTPSKPTGTVSVQVTNPGGSPLTLTEGFFYMPPDAPRNFFTLLCRLLDTRDSGALVGYSRRVVQVTGMVSCLVPSSAKAISANVSVFGSSAEGYFGAFPGNGFPVGTAILTVNAGQPRSNNAVLLLATDGAGTVLLQNGTAAEANMVIDVSGYFQ